MPVPVITQLLAEGLDSLPYFYPVLKTLPWLVGLYLVKTYFEGARNGSERNMHGKVVLVTVSLLFVQ